MQSPWPELGLRRGHGQSTQGRELEGGAQAGFREGMDLLGHRVTSVLPLLLSSHNWNTLFMGPNAVADAIAQKYDTTKSQVFDHVSEEPLRVVSFLPALSRGTAAELS